MTGNCRCVFIVDDDPIVLESLQVLLRASGLEVQAFGSAEQFLDSAPLDQPGCVVTDLQMPGLNGYDLLRRLRAADSPLAAVIVTGVADVPTAVKLMEDGAVTLLEKPYDAAELLSATQRALAQSQARDAQARQNDDIRQRYALLTPEERRVLAWMLRGEVLRNVAQSLRRSTRTLDRRRSSVLRKMQANSAPELALLLAAAGLAEEVQALEPMPLE